MYTSIAQTQQLYFFDISCFTRDMPKQRILLGIVICAAILSWALYLRPASSVMHAQMQAGMSGHIAEHPEQQLCETISATPECAMSLAEHQAVTETLAVSGFSALVLLALSLFVALISITGLSGSPRVLTTSPPGDTWRLRLHKLIDPFARLLRAGVIHSKEYARV